MQARSKWRPSSSTSPAPSEANQVVLEVVTGLDQIVYFFIINRSTAATSPTSTSSLPHLQTSRHYSSSSASPHRSPSHATSSTTATTPSSGVYTHDSQYSLYRRSSRPIDIIRWMRDTINWLKLEANFHVCNERTKVYDSSTSSDGDICMEYKR